MIIPNIWEIKNVPNHQPDQNTSAPAWFARKIFLQWDRWKLARKPILDEALPCFIGLVLTGNMSPELSHFFKGSQTPGCFRLRSYKTNSNKTQMIPILINFFQKKCSIQLYGSTPMTSWKASWIWNKTSPGASMQGTLWRHAVCAPPWPPRHGWSTGPGWRILNVHIPYLHINEKN